MARCWKWGASRCRLCRRAAAANGDQPPDRRRQLVGNLAELLQREAALIERQQPKSLVNRCGYHLHGVLDHEHLDLARLIVGSEGTLALITEATLATQPLPAHRGLAVLLFERLDSALKAVQEIVPLGPSACDLMDRRHLSLARETDARYESQIPAGDRGAAAGRIRRATIRPRSATACSWSPTAFAAAAGWPSMPARCSTPPRSISTGSWPSKTVPNLFRLKGSTRPLPFVEDMAVPPAELPAFLVQLQNMLKRHQVTASLFGHAGHGQLHVRPFLDLADPADVHKMEALAADLYQALFDVGGTHQRRARGRPEPHAVRPPAVRRAVRRVPRGEADLRSRGTCSIPAR